MEAFFTGLGGCKDGDGGEGHSVQDAIKFVSCMYYIAPHPNSEATGERVQSSQQGCSFGTPLPISKPWALNFCKSFHTPTLMGHDSGLVVGEKFAKFNNLSGRDFLRFHRCFNRSFNQNQVLGIRS